MISQDKDLLLTAHQLKNRQSVRATFRLSQQAIDLLTICASLLGIKQKSLFDQLVDDKSVLKCIAQKAQENRPNTDGQRQQKTFVLSRNSLINLNRTAKAQKVPRDLLVEMSIDRLVPIINKEKEQHKKRKKLLALLDDYYQNGQKLLAHAEHLVGTEESFYDLLYDQIEIQRKTIRAVEAIIQKGEAMKDQESSI